MLLETLFYDYFLQSDIFEFYYFFDLLEMIL